MSRLRRLWARLRGPRTCRYCARMIDRRGYVLPDGTRAIPTGADLDNWIRSLDDGIPTTEVERFPERWPDR